MDDTQRSFYGLKFENAFLREKGKAFETLFARLMGHAYPGDFEPVRPYGAKGDQKCDGYRASNGTVFQSYAPDAIKLKSLLAKIDIDFPGAVLHWAARMKKWTLVHNDVRGLPAEMVGKLADLRTAHPNVDIEVFGFPELRDIVMSLRRDQLEDLFGAAPSQRTLEKIGFAELRPVLLSIQRQEPPAEPPLTAPSLLKLQNNRLSWDVADFLKQGRRREKLVQDFFDVWPDPGFGEEIAEAFRKRYHALKVAGITQDEVFSELQRFAGGMDGVPSHQAAVLAVMSYFFERCDIFEDAGEDVQS